MTIRWPEMINMTISTVNQSGITPVQSVVSELEALRLSILSNESLTELREDGGPNVALFNAELATFPDKRWGSVPWLYAECYLCRSIRTTFALCGEQWCEFDPWCKMKMDGLKSSGKAISESCSALLAILESKLPEPQSEAMVILIQDMLIQNLWGNSSDLSMLAGDKVDISTLDSIQSVGKEARNRLSRNILRDDTKEAAEHIQKLEGRRIDIVLDNSGFELFTDLVLADFLVSSTPFVSQVVFHPKQQMWFISDVIPKDMWSLLESMQQSAFFTFPGSNTKDIQQVSSRWLSFFKSGTFKLSTEVAMGKSDEIVDFWTTGLAFQHLPEFAPSLRNHLNESGLVIFKGDLNYRKLTSDGLWKAEENFQTVLGPLAKEFPILSLRTNKADVIVGLQQGLAEKLDGDSETGAWRSTGKFAVIMFSNKV